MKDEREAEAREPQQETGRYETQAGTSAPAAPVGQREGEAQSEDDASNRMDTESIDERASTTKTQPMARLGNEPQVESHASAATSSSGIMNDQRLEYFAGRWDSIQSGFVDDPRRTVEQADRLVAEVIDHLAKLFRDERAKLEGQWSRNGEANTEDLRIAMQRYRDFFRTLVGR